MIGRIFCAVRKKWVAALPEEMIRQKLILKMVSELGFPKNLITVEKEIGSLPDGAACAKRRLDVLCFRVAETGLVPLLLAECKSISLNDGAARQVLGYNASIQAPFICLAGESEIKTFWIENGKIASVPYLPQYADLVKFACC